MLSNVTWPGCKTAGDSMRRRSRGVRHPSFRNLQMPRQLPALPPPRFNNVCGEWSLMAPCYNLTCILDIPGFKHLVAHLAELLLPLERPFTAVLDCFQNRPRRIPGSR